MFNEVQVGRLKKMKELGFQLGHNIRTFAIEMDHLRIDVAETRTEMSTLDACRSSQRAKLSVAEVTELDEGLVYTSK